MTQSTERAEFEAWMGAANLSRTPFDDYKNDYVDGQWQAWQAARRAQVVPDGFVLVPKSHLEAWETQLLSAFHAAAPQSPEADIGFPISNGNQQVAEAAPVELPDCRGRVIVDEDGECEITWRGGMPPENGTNIYTEHQVRQLLATTHNQPR